MKNKTIDIQLEPKTYINSLEHLLNILLPDNNLNFHQEDFNNNPLIRLKLDEDAEESGPLKTELVLEDGDNQHREVHYHDEILDPRYSGDDYQRRGRDLLKNHLYTFLCDYLGKEKSPWGILVGIRPTKIVHFLRDKGFNYSEIRGILKEVYGISQEKIQLITRICEIEERYLPKKSEARKRLSLYIGIPFCPSRCSYCSFPSFSLKKHGRYMKPFLETLLQEIETVGSFIKENNLEVDSIYLGGGTPTSLSSQQLERLLTHLADNISTDNLKEYTVEGGRPDTITREKLKILHDARVERISINPQTMCQQTLEAIGREHTIAEVKDSFHLAKEIGFENINMDLIVGLPGEKMTDIERTMEELLQLGPESVTVHTLSLKKASKWWDWADELPFPDEEELTRMLNYVATTLKAHNRLPYYMYRQKYILANQENVGYSLPGKESLYNMIMIDERETVIGLGGGAVTKAVNPDDWSLSRHYNPKHPAEYISNIDQILDKKLSMLTSFL